MAKHVESINIQSFRGIRNLSIQKFGDINVLIGDNNSGKTSLLEAIMLLVGPSDFSNFASVSRLRERYNFMSKGSLGLYDSFLYMFDRRNENLNIKLDGEVNEHQIAIEVIGNKVKQLVDPKELRQFLSPLAQKRLTFEPIDIEEVEGFEGELKYSHGGETKTEPILMHKYIKNIRVNRTEYSLPSRFISTIEHIVNNTSRSLFKSSSIKRDVVRALNIFDNNIIDIGIIQEEDQRFIQALEHRSLGMLPLSTFGDGMKRMVSLAQGVVSAKNGVLLIDEIETSIHKKAMREVFNWLVEACIKFDVQLFITTHSLEAVDEILNSDENFQEQIQTHIITLVKKDEQSVARVLDSNKARQVRDDYDMELRL
ncbi:MULTISPECIES: AAA family ATPase [unclassified Paenibacillus]|uniref:AAA family ATPase n=1 Tax=unclassified Paenibacillus TaxID=185978 RepID=UPI0030FAE631